jgi:Flp pilus assembly protein TadG
VEFALIIPIFIFMMLVMIDFGRLLYVQISLNSASREGARASSLGLPAETAQSLARAAAPGVGGLAGVGGAATLSVSVSTTSGGAGATCSGAVAGNRTEVVVATTFDWITPIGFAQSVASSSSPGTDQAISAKAVMLCAA